jgi:hypothetical protein
MIKKNYDINDVVHLFSGQIVLIVGSNKIPYNSPLYRKDEFPENGFDYIILCKDKKHDGFSGKDYIKEIQIESYVKNLYND